MSVDSKNKLHNIAVVGLGYVGLSLAVLLAVDHEVRAVEIVKDKVDKVNKRISPIDDAEIKNYLATKNLNLRATSDTASTYEWADVVIVAVPTNYDENTNYFDTSCVDDVITQVYAVNKDALIVIKSTIPVGYTDRVSSKFEGIEVIFSPEFLREGKALYDNLYPSRIVVGIPKNQCLNESMRCKANSFAVMLADAAIKDDIQSIILSADEAEAVKLFSNTYLATRVAFFNELDAYAESHGMNSRAIIDAVTLDPRVGDHYCNPSFGYGGYCLPKDTKQLLADYSKVPQAIIEATVKANDIRKNYIASQIAEILNRKNGKTVGAFRLTMKSGSDNFRSSSIQDVIRILSGIGINIVIYEPTLQAHSYEGYRVINDLNNFKSCCDLIIANRMDQEIEDVMDKVYTRDCYYRD